MKLFMPLPRCRQPVTVIGAPSWPRSLAVSAARRPLSRSTSAASWRLQAAPVSATARPQPVINDVVHLEFIRFLLSPSASKSWRCTLCADACTAGLEENHVPWMNLGIVRAALVAGLLATALCGSTFAQDLPPPTIDAS